MNGEYVSQQPHIVVGGAPGSGVKLFGKLLDAHPLVRCGPPTNMFVVNIKPDLDKLTEDYQLQPKWLPSMVARSIDRVHFVDLFAGMAKARAGKRRWADATPRNVLHVGEGFFNRFPEAMFVHVVRKGTDAVCASAYSPEVPILKRLTEWHTWTAAGFYWRNDPHYIEVRYEDLTNSEKLTDVFDRLCLSWDDRLLDALKGLERPRASCFDAAQNIIRDSLSLRSLMDQLEYAY